MPGTPPKRSKSEQSPPHPGDVASSSAQPGPSTQHSEDTASSSSHAPPPQWVAIAASINRGSVVKSRRAGQEGLFGRSLEGFSHDPYPQTTIATEIKAFLIKSSTPYFSAIPKFQELCNTLYQFSYHHGNYAPELLYLLGNIYRYELGILPKLHDKKALDEDNAIRLEYWSRYYTETTPTKRLDYWLGYYYASTTQPLRAWLSAYGSSLLQTNFHTDAETKLSVNLGSIAGKLFTLALNQCIPTQLTRQTEVMAKPSDELVTELLALCESNNKPIITPLLNIYTRLMTQPDVTPTDTLNTLRTASQRAIKRVLSGTKEHSVETLTRVLINYSYVIHLLEVIPINSHYTQLLLALWKGLWSASLLHPNSKNEREAAIEKVWTQTTIGKILVGESTSKQEKEQFVQDIIRILCPFSETDQFKALSCLPIVPETVRDQFFQCSLDDRYTVLAEKLYTNADKTLSLLLSSDEEIIETLSRLLHQNHTRTFCWLYTQLYKDNRITPHIRRALMPLLEKNDNVFVTYTVYITLSSRGKKQFISQRLLNITDVALLRELESLSFISDSGVNIAAVSDIRGYNLFMLAIESNYQALQDHYEANYLSLINGKDATGKTPLARACSLWKNNPEESSQMIACVQALIHRVPAIAKHHLSSNDLENLLAILALYPGLVHLDLSHVPVFPLEQLAPILVGGQLKSLNLSHNGLRYNSLTTLYQEIKGKQNNAVRETFVLDLSHNQLGIIGARYAIKLARLLNATVVRLENNGIFFERTNTEKDEKDTTPLKSNFVAGTAYHLRQNLLPSSFFMHNMRVQETEDSVSYDSLILQIRGNGKKETLNLSNGIIAIMQWPNDAAYSLLLEHISPNHQYRIHQIMWKRKSKETFAIRVKSIDTDILSKCGTLISYQIVNKGTIKNALAQARDGLNKLLVCKPDDDISKAGYESLLQSLPLIPSVANSSIQLSF